MNSREQLEEQLDVAEDVIFQVRFYYKETEPVGILYFMNAKYAAKAMEKNGAVRLYAYADADDKGR